MQDFVACSHKNLENFSNFGSNSKCDFVLSYCGEESTYFDLIGFYYCTLDQSLLLIILLALPWLSFCFYWLASTSEKYLEPSLSLGAATLGLSQSLAGVTIIALANGMPDIISAYAAGNSKGPHGLNIVFGSLFGASIFSISIVLSVLLYYSRNLQLPGKVIIRDCIFYVLADVYILYLGTLSEIQLVHISGIFLFYALFVIFTVYQEIQMHRAHDLSLSIHDISRLASMNNVFNDQIELVKHRDVSPKFDHPLVLNSQILDLEVHQARVPSFKLLFQQDLSMHDSINDDITHNDGKWRKVVKYLELPLDIVRDLTIPVIRRTKIDKLLIPLYPLFAGILVMWQLEYIYNYGDNVLFWVMFVSVAAVLGATLHLISKNRRGIEILSWVFIPLSAIISIVWLQVVANLLLDLLILIKIGSSLPSQVIGLTLIAWGNSLGDMFIGIALAKKGLGVMAISGIFAGQLFNLQIGFGLVLLNQTGIIRLNLFTHSNEDRINLILVLFSLIGLVCTLIYGSLKKFKFNNTYRYYLMGFYLIFCIVIASVIYYGHVNRIKITA